MGVSMGGSVHGVCVCLGGCVSNDVQEGIQRVCRGGGVIQGVSMLVCVSGRMSPQTQRHTPLTQRLTATDPEADTPWTQRQTPPIATRCQPRWVEGPEVNKFDQVFSDGHTMLLAVGSLHSEVPCP